MTCHTSLSFCFCYSAFQVMLLVVLRVHRWDKDRCMSEQVVHFFERSLCRFRLDSPKEECVCEVTHNLRDPVSFSSVCRCSVTYEEIVEAISDSLNSYWCNLANHRVEGKARHRRYRNTFAACSSIEDLGGYYPRERTICRTE